MLKAMYRIVNTVFSLSKVTNGGGERVVVSPARAESQGADASQAMAITVVLGGVIKILVIQYPYMNIYHPIYMCTFADTY